MTKVVHGVKPGTIEGSSTLTSFYPQPSAGPAHMRSGPSEYPTCCAGCAQRPIIHSNSGSIWALDAPTGRAVARRSQRKRALTSSPPVVWEEENYVYTWDYEERCFGLMSNSKAIQGQNLKLKSMLPADEVVVYAMARVHTVTG